MSTAVAGGMVDYFLKVDGIDGEAEDSGHENEIKLHSYSFGGTNQGSYGLGTTGGGTGRVSMADLHVVMTINKASPSLFLACANGKAIDSVILTCRKSAGDSPIDFLKITLSDVRVTTYQSGGGTELIPVDTCSFNFKQIEVEYTPQDDTGGGGSPTTIGWDVAKNTKM